MQQEGKESRFESLLPACTLKCSMWERKYYWMLFLSPVVKENIKNSSSPNSSSAIDTLCYSYRSQEKSLELKQMPNTNGRHNFSWTASSRSAGVCKLEGCPSPDSYGYESHGHALQLISCKLGVLAKFVSSLHLYHLQPQLLFWLQKAAA